MVKRERTPDATEDAKKRTRMPPKPATFNPIKVATVEAANAVDANPPFKQLMKGMENVIQNPEKGNCVVYWMRMTDLRLSDNRALSKASEKAKEDGVPVAALFVISPQDFIAHDRGARKIDFTLRNLRVIKEQLANLHIPLHTVTIMPRKKIPEKVLALVGSLGCKRMYANIEYEVDELRRDIKLCEVAAPLGIQVNLTHNRSVIEPGVLFAPSSGKAYAVYTPYRRLWVKTANEDLSHYLDEVAYPSANDASVRGSKLFVPLFDSEIPNFVEGFVLDEEDSKKMTQTWPEGEDKAREVLLRFLGTKARSTQLGAVDPLASGAQGVTKHNRVVKYDEDRDRADKDTTSRLSPYLSSGVLSIREVFRTTMDMFNLKKIDADGKTGASKWIQEIIWRDFYTDILASFPRVSMGRPFLEKFAGIVWENHQAPHDPNAAGNPDSDAEGLMRWKLGKTGVPIVDAAMRCINGMGWVHNRPRMIVAMYLTKHLMIDWRVGERYFMEKLIDGDLASNNGGWQWSASTGVDPCPYFRIFNPYNQSEKTDPSGDFIRHWVPELKQIRGPATSSPRDTHAMCGEFGSVIRPSKPPKAPGIASKFSSSSMHSEYSACSSSSESSNKSKMSAIKRWFGMD
ncbi:photolyase [Coprinellus micaceus]|uniref:Photolyase n=1 Tax=Coprinellus micaceus TaxID=71717 RepID=A0A4Y7TN51_COPMI|nr:photolyase [Coprinellus micaceus]